MADDRRTTYDEVPYESYPFAQTHPDRLATVATLLGLSPPRVDRCRVLELGCAAGGNLIPMAQTLPDSRFVGIDLSGRQVAAGQQVIRTLGLPNIELQQLSILDVGPDFGPFDYIICHGVYSWVPPAVQDQILTICKRSLAANGVAYVSYNTYPGWHLRGVIRDLMSYHANHFTDPQTRVKQARNLLDFLARSSGQENSPYSLLLKSELEAIRQSRDAYLFHEHLEEVNDPVYFHQFAGRAADKGLRYLGEVDLPAMVPGNYPPEVEKVLQMLSPDIIHMEQYMDFLRNRMFRQTLLCHQDQVVHYAIQPELVTRLHVASAARSVADKPDLHSTEVEQFRSPAGATLFSRDPLVKAAMAYLAEVWPQAVPFDRVRSEARARLNGAAPPDRAAAVDEVQHLGKCLLSFYTSPSRLVEFHVQPPPLTTAVSTRPQASPLARLQAAAGDPVTNLRHEVVVLGDFERQIVRHLDGDRDHTALSETLAALAAQGVLRVAEHGRPVQESGRLRALLSTALEEQLPKLARSALLMS